MKYLQTTFTLPVNCKHMTDAEYAKRVGANPPKKGTTKNQQVTAKTRKRPDRF